MTETSQKCFLLQDSGLPIAHLFPSIVALCEMSHSVQVYKELQSGPLSPEPWSAGNFLHSHVFSLCFRCACGFQPSPVKWWAEKFQFTPNIHQIHVHFTRVSQVRVKCRLRLWNCSWIFWHVWSICAVCGVIVYKKPKGTRKLLDISSSLKSFHRGYIWEVKPRMRKTGSVTQWSTQLQVVRGRETCIGRLCLRCEPTHPWKLFIWLFSLSLKLIKLRVLQHWCAHHARLVWCKDGWENLHWCVLNVLWTSECVHGMLILKEIKTNFFYKELSL